MSESLLELLDVLESAIIQFVEQRVVNLEVHVEELKTRLRLRIRALNAEATANYGEPCDWMQL